LAHAADDTVIPVQDGQEFADAARKQGNPIVYLESPVGGHGFPLLMTATKHPELAAVGCTVLAWLAAFTKP
jgi:acetyl esterase/lipase